ncbi:hypothetical protein H8E52_07275 [bacterium]|nr:hypothetical protein [bacterium]
MSGPTISGIGFQKTRVKNGERNRFERVREMAESDPAGTGSGVLVRDVDSSTKYVKYHRLHAIAEREGRIDGKYRCPVCGMRYLAFDEADVCCKNELAEK